MGKLFKVSILFFMILLSVLLISCAQEKPYQEYLQAVKKLKATDSFMVEKNAELVQHETILGKTNENKTKINTVDKIVKDISDYSFISNMTVYVNDGKPEKSIYYHRDGVTFINNLTDKQSTKITMDAAKMLDYSGIDEFPKDVIAKETVTETAEGRLITFVMDSEKYYAYRFPKTSYGEYAIYREPPKYTVLLDQEGFIKKVTSSMCTVNTDKNAFTEKQTYIAIFSQYNNVQLVFPDLKPDEYPDRSKLEQ